MTAQITTLIPLPSTTALVRDKIAAILVAESAAQQVIAATPSVAYTRASGTASTSTCAASAIAPAVLQFGAYVVTAGTLTAGVGTWTAVAPDGTIGTFTSTSAGQDLTFSGLGLLLDVTAGSVVWRTGDVVTATVYDPHQWALRVFTEAAAPWSEWIDSPPQSAAAAVPIVCVSTGDQEYPEKTGNVVERQRAGTMFWLDCYGYGIATETDTGHDPGDVAASSEAERARELVRAILMASQYTYLDMRGLVGKRWVEGTQRFQPQSEDRCEIGRAHV